MVNVTDFNVKDIFTVIVVQCICIV